VVLIDGDSASASEIFAGAIRDHDRGYVVGQVSYGKGSVQGVFHNDRGNGGLRLTVSKFYSPNGSAISSRGILPHIVVPEDPVSAPQSLTALRPNLDNQKFVAQIDRNSDAPLAAGALSAQRPVLDAMGNANANPRFDATLEKGLQVAREMQSQAR
jgi:carboxyl-terminal processing protease